jgi:small subunit ribosomal protein S1
MNNNESKDTANSFASMFEKSLAKMDKLQPGQQMETTIVSISGDTIFLQLSGKSEGVLARAELTDKDGKLTVKEGDTVKVYFLNAKNGEMRFTARIGGQDANNDMIESAFKNGIPVEGIVEKEIKGGYEIKIGGTRAFCPFSQMGQKKVEGAESPVGKNLTFKIQEYAERGRKIVVSNRAIAEEERKQQIAGLRDTLKEGMTVKGTITSIQDFGAFVDVSGFKALLPISEIARERVTDIKTLLSVGQEIEAEIIRLDWKNEKMAVSLKSLLADPWENVAAKYTKASKHEGTVSRVANFGVFVSLEPGIDGLLHISELQGDGQFAGAKKIPKAGEKLTVVVKEVDAANHRISLQTTSSFEEDASVKKYFGGGSSDGDGDTYNPFAALLKKK